MSGLELTPVIRDRKNKSKIPASYTKLYWQIRKMGRNNISKENKMLIDLQKSSLTNDFLSSQYTLN